MAKKEQLTHRIHTRVTQKKYDELLGMLQQSRGIRSLSELLRNILDNKKIVTVTYDRTLDKVMETLSGIHTELHAIGININQVTRRFHTEQLPESRLIQALELLQLYQQTDKKVAALFDLITALSKKWLPE